MLIRLGEGRNPEPTAAIIDSRTLRGTPESGHRAGYDGHKKKDGTKIHIAVDTLGELLALVATPADAQDRAQVEELAARMQEVTDGSIEVVYADQNYTGPTAAAGGSGLGHPVGGREAARGQARVRAVAAPLGGGALVRLGEPISATGQGLYLLAVGSTRRIATVQSNFHIPNSQ